MPQPESPVEKSDTPVPDTQWERDWAAQRRLRRITGLPGLMRCMGRGFRKLCPKCGKGSVVTGFLLPNTACESCGEGYAHIRTDDFAPWMSIMVLAHLLMPAMISVERLWHPPFWLHLLIWVPLAIEFVVVFLPRAKGMALGLMWGLNIRGDEHQH
jgi:uncharacterized protein (DUF983 family)